MTVGERIERREPGDGDVADLGGTGKQVRAALHCESLQVAYGAEPVLADLDLTIGHGESLALLGPSGSGKTTLLYAIAGFISVSAGTIQVGGEVVATTQREQPPERRDVGVVFQHYALWPHLTALETVAYPLRRRRVATREARRRATDLLERMDIAELADRRPAELSGGQQQRVGLARALASDARLYLFDEPTAHLDAALKSALQEELTERRRAAGAAALHATHDAAEALAVADRVALLRDGHVVQVGTPTEVYARPVDLWAARLTGAASVLAVELVSLRGGYARLTLAGAGDREVAEPRPSPKIDVAAGGAAGQRGRVPALVRPDWARLGGPLSATVRQVAYRGPYSDYRLDTGAGELVLRSPGPPTARVGEVVDWRLDRVWLLAPSGPEGSGAPVVDEGR